MTYFTIAELTASDTAKRLHINNTPGTDERASLEALVLHVLDPARAAIGMPVRVTSGYRCRLLNIAVRGATNSQHAKGQAADVTCNDNAKLFYYIWKNLDYDQLIWEKGSALQPSWVHVSFNNRAERQRHQCLRTIDGSHYFDYTPKPK